MSIVLQGSTSGSITLQEPAIAGSTTINLPATTGTALVAPTALTVPNTTGTVMVSGNMPAFSAYANAAQTISNNTFTKCTFNVEEFDTNNNFTSSTFTPTVAGYYQVNCVLMLQATTTVTRAIVSIYKNGATIGREFDVTLNSGTNPINGSGARVIYMNGSTDYLEVYGFITGTGTLSLSGTTTQNTSYFSACLVRAA